MPPAYLKAGTPAAPPAPYADGCTGKVRFASARLAAEVARDRRGFGPRTDGDKRSRDAYRCQACGGWHLGTRVNMQKGPGS